MSEKHFNIFNSGSESFFTAGRQLADIARVKPDAPAIIHISSEEKESIMTWRELETLSNRIAWYLMDQGIGPGKSIVVALGNIPTHIALAFGIWKAGACYVPISPKVPMKNMAEICQCVSPSLVVTNRRKADGYINLSSSELRNASLGYSEAMPSDILAVPNMANCSGGTTGKTKVIEQCMPAGESDEGLRSWFYITGMEFEMRQLLAGPLFHGAPHTAAFNGLYCGNTLVMPSGFDPALMVKLIKKYEIEFVQMVPTLMQRIINLPDFNKDDLQSLKSLYHTGGICTKDLKDAWLQVLPPDRIHEVYSMSECIGMTCIRGDEWIEHRGSVGRMLGGLISIRDDEGNELPANEIGNIYMNWGDNSPKVIYKNVEPITADDKGYKSVGDMGYLDSDGYLYFADRRSDMIVTGGENVFAAEVESVLKKHRRVLDAVVIGLPDAEWGHRIHAIIERRESVTSKELIKFALDYFPPYKIPKSFEFVDEIPRNESGKTVRSKLIEESLQKGY